jgi:hypothetical protein
MKEALLSRKGEALVLGVRPEAISDKEHARFATDEGGFEFRVTLVQPLGDKMDVYLATDQHPRVIAHFDAASGIRAGERSARSPARRA